MGTGKTRRRLVVGLTGGIGSGKSEALSALGRLGAVTIDLDAVAREQAKPGGPAFRAVVKALGRGILDRGGRIDREKVAALVFKKESILRRLENATHPPILREMRRRAGAARGVVVIDVPLLFEKKLEREFDVTMLVTASRGTRLGRLRKRGVPRPEALRRMRAQLSDEAKSARADLLVSNDASKDRFRRRLKEYHQAFTLMQESPA